MPKPKKHPTVARVREVFDYDPTTGVMTRKVRLGNNGQAGKVVGSDGKQGYLYVSLDHGRYLLHRIAWAHYHGEWPSQVIDHIDGNGYNNAIRNLRDVAHRANSANMLRNKSMRADAAKWRAYQESLTVAEPEDDKLNLDRLADYIADNWPDKKYSLEEIAQRLHATWPTAFMPAEPADQDEDAYVIAKLGNLLAQIAVIVKGPEPALTRWSYHDLPELVAKATAAQPAASVDSWIEAKVCGYTPGERLVEFRLPAGWRQKGLALELGDTAFISAAPVDAQPSVPDHLIERLRKHCDDRSNTAFARSSMREALQYLSKDA